MYRVCVDLLTTDSHWVAFTPRCYLLPFLIKGKYTRIINIKIMYHQYVITLILCKIGPEFEGKSCRNKVFLKTDLICSVRCLFCTPLKLVLKLFTTIVCSNRV